MELNIGEEYNELGYKAMYCNKYLKIFCKDVNKYVKISENNKNNKLYLNYKFKDKYENKILTREIVYVDKDSPEIRLSDAKIEMCPNETFIETGYSAYDNVDGNITDKVIVSIKNNKIYYNVADSSGNSRVVFRDIKYIDKEKPKIKLSGSDTVYIYKGNEYIDSGFEALDDCDGNISNNVAIENNINTDQNGEYFVNYSVSDSYGNKNTISRKVIVYSDVSVIPKNGKIIYLTFDDGPGSYTEEILNVLDKYNVKATFFVTNQFRNYQQLIKREYDNGHSIAVHTESHNYKKIYNSVDDYINDFNNMNQIIFEQTGVYSNIFRFPGGTSNTISKFNKGIMTKLSNKMLELGYYYFDWNVDSLDTKYKDPEKIANAVISELDKNEHSIVLMHDIKSANVESVDKIVSYGLENGYTFLPLDSNSPAIRHKVIN